MKPDEFVYYLYGFLTANKHLKSLDEKQTKDIKDKLNSVFNKVTPELNLNEPQIPKTKEIEVFNIAPDHSERKYC